MGWLRRILGRGEAEPEDELEPRAPAASDAEASARIDEARDRLREEIPPREED